MPRTIDLSGTYVIASVSPTEIVLSSPEEVNPNWNYADLDGAGTTGYDHNISLITPPASQRVDLSGTGYTVAAVTPTSMTLTTPEGVNTDWTKLANFVSSGTGTYSPNISTTNNANWIGPFIVDDADTTLLMANFLATGGLYKDNGNRQTAFPITITLEATPVDLLDSPIGPAQTFTTTIPGNSSGRDQRAATLVCELSIPGRQSVRARRTTFADLNYKGTVVDDVKWQDLYGLAAVPVSDFGNVTTVHSRTYATEGALAVKNRKLNMLATRLVPIRTVGTAFNPPAPTTDAANIFTAACLDPFIGGRQLAELDLDSIYGAVADAEAYFGSTDAGQFCYTFDDDSISFEETAATIANAVFCSAFRLGSTVKMELEKATEDSQLLFNHRNKLPATETRTIRFGYLDNNDGVEVQYVSPVDDTFQTLYLPTDRSASKPRQIKALGVRSRKQAYWQAWRAWNKIRFQNVGVEFTALQEAALVARNSRVLVADNTRAETQDGEVIGQSGLQLQISQPVAFAAGGYTMFIQLPDGTVDAMAVTAGVDDHHVVISRAPRVALIFGNDQYALPSYQIVRNDSPRPDAFLISSREADSSYSYTIQAINYSYAYYANDQLAVWLDFQSLYLDAGPWGRDATAIGGAIVNDATRGKVYQTASGGRITLPAFTAPASYTKALWVRRDSLAGGGAFFSGSGATEFLAFDGAGHVVVSHDGSTWLLTATWPGLANEWHHLAATYDAGGELAIYLDGLQASVVEGAPRGTLSNLAAIGANGTSNFAGAVDDMRLLTRALSAAEIHALCLATKL